MANVCVITGGGSGIGLETAKHMPAETILVIAGRTPDKLEKAKAILEQEGRSVHPVTCDVSSRKEVHELCLAAKRLGTIKAVIHAAGLSPTMADPDSIIRVNALGTRNVNMEFCKFMDEGGVVVDIASSAAYEAPAILVKHQIYEMAENDEDAFVRHLNRESRMAPGDYSKAGMAYTMSKNFVVWYAKKCAHEFASRGIRVVSVSPGLVATDMGRKKSSRPLLPRKW